MQCFGNYQLAGARGCVLLSSLPSAGWVATGSAPLAGSGTRAPPSRALVVSRTWSPPLAPLPLRQAREEKWKVAQGCMVRPAGSLVHFRLRSIGWHSVTWPKPNYAAGI